MSSDRMAGMVKLLRARGMTAEQVNHGTLVRVPVRDGVSLALYHLEGAGCWVLVSEGVVGLRMRLELTQDDPGVARNAEAFSGWLRDPWEGEPPGEAQSGALRSPQRDGMEGVGGEGAQDSGGSARVPRRYRLMVNLGGYGAVAGILGFASFSEPDGPVDAGWALVGMFVTLGLGVAIAVHGLFAGERWRQRQRDL